MNLRSFQDASLSTISEALGIAEDKTGDFFKFSFDQWKRHRYDVKTLPVLRENEISAHAFALLNKGTRVISNFESRSKKRDFYFICLQDHQILEALRKDRNLNLLPLLVYIFAHELVHIVRFCNFSQRFDITGKGREKEERIVHSTTFEILRDLSISRMDYVLGVYRNHRICELAVS